MNLKDLVEDWRSPAWFSKTKIAAVLLGVLGLYNNVLAPQFELPIFVSTETFTTVLIALGFWGTHNATQDSEARTAVRIAELQEQIFEAVEESDADTKSPQ